MKNMLLMILVAMGLFVMMGCAGQNTTTADQNKATPPSKNTTEQVVSNTSNTGQTQPEQNTTAPPPTKFTCTPGAHYNNMKGLSGTVVGIETFRGRQTCHVTYSFSADAKYDYYLDMSNPDDFCTAMSSGDGSEPTISCDWPQ